MKNRKRNDEMNHVFWNGQLLELLTSNNDAFYTQIIHHEPYLLVQKPVNRENNPMIIKNKMPVQVFFDLDLQGLYMFDSNIFQYQNKIIISRPKMDSIKKAQRRHFFRVHVNLEMHLTLSSCKYTSERKDMTILTHDISGGGVSFLCLDRIVEEGDLVEGRLHLKPSNAAQKIILFNARVVYIMKQDHLFYKFALQFVNMKESVRTEIIKFCMFKQIELRKKVRNSSIV